MADPRHIIGERAEAIVAAWLASRGWTILAQRWRRREGEIDIVALDPIGTLVAVEVKLRRSERTGGSLASVGATRLRRLRAALARFAGEAPRGVAAGMRLDLVVARPAEDGRWRLTHYRAIDGW